MKITHLLKKDPFEVNKYWQYKLLSYLGAYDSLIDSRTEPKRILAYRLGWSLFENVPENRVPKRRKRFKKFHINLYRKKKWFRILAGLTGGVSMLLLIFLLFYLFTPDELPGRSIIFLIILLSLTAIFGAVSIFYRGPFSKNERENLSLTKEFFEFLETEKKYPYHGNYVPVRHWDMFLDIDYQKPESATEFFDLFYKDRSPYRYLASIVFPKELPPRREEEEFLTAEEQGQPKEPEPQHNIEPKNAEGKPTFIPEAFDVIFPIIKDFFSPEDQNRLEQLLKTGENTSPPLVFLDNGNRLADTLRKLYEYDFIVGCQKQDLQGWVVRNFRYTNRRRVEFFKPGTADKYISRNYPCKNPIIEITKDRKILRSGHPRKKTYNKH